jgi:hypothetical protein
MTRGGAPGDGARHECRCATDHEQHGEPAPPVEPEFAALLRHAGFRHRDAFVSHCRRLLRRQRRAEHARAAHSANASPGPRLATGAACALACGDHVPHPTYAGRAARARPGLSRPRDWRRRWRADADSRSSTWWLIGRSTRALRDARRLTATGVAARRLRGGAVAHTLAGTTVRLHLASASLVEVSRGPSAGRFGSGSRGLASRPSWPGPRSRGREWSVVGALRGRPRSVECKKRSPLRSTSPGWLPRSPI